MRAVEWPPGATSNSVDSGLHAAGRYHLKEGQSPAVFLLARQQEDVAGWGGVMTSKEGRSFLGSLLLIEVASSLPNTS